MNTRKILTTAELAQVTAGGVDYIRTKNNQVRGLALRMDLNPDAPDIIVFGKGPRIEGRARLFLDSDLVVPAYLKIKTNEWEYVGHYRAIGIRTDAHTIQKYGKKRKRGTVAGALFLEAVTKPEVEIVGRGFADPETRKEVESAAVAFVQKELIKRGFQVEDYQKKNEGYDLRASLGPHRLLAEVKGTDYGVPRFFISRREYQCSQKEKDWRLFVVCQARSKPILHEYSAEQMRQNFAFDPLAWECRQVE